jgi:hypothetical protein
VIYTYRVTSFGDSSDRYHTNRDFVIDDWAACRNLRSLYFAIDDFLMTVRGTDGTLFRVHDVSLFRYLEPFSAPVE